MLIASIRKGKPSFQVASFPLSICLAIVFAMAMGTGAPSPLYAQTPQQSNATALLFNAVKKGDMDAVQASIDNGANLTERNAAGQTPGDLAVQLKHFDIVKFLLSVEAANKAREAIAIDLEEDASLDDDKPLDQTLAPLPAQQPVTTQKKPTTRTSNPFAWVVNNRDGTTTATLPKPSSRTPTTTATPAPGVPVKTQRVETTTSGERLPARFSWVVTNKNESIPASTKPKKPGKAVDELDQFPFDDKQSNSASKAVDPNDLFGDLSLEQVDNATGDNTSDKANDLFGDLNELDGTSKPSGDEGTSLAQATPPVRKKIELLPPSGNPLDATTKLMITRALVLGNPVKMKADGKSYRNPCIQDDNPAVVFCTIPALWSKQMRRYTDVQSIMYQGVKSIVRYDNGVATRYHAFFKPEYYQEVIAHFQDRFGAPTEAGEETIHPFAKPAVQNPVTTWQMDNETTGEKAVLEIIKYDDTRSAFPDMTRGAIMLYKLPEPTLFPELSPLDFLLRNVMADVT